MARRAFSIHDYNAMVDAFRSDAPKYRPGTAARVCGSDIKTCAKAWKVGWPTRKWAPIRSVIETELEEERLKKLQAAADERERQAQNRELARMKKVRAADDEARIVEIARQNALTTISAGMTLAVKAQALADLAQNLIDIDVARADGDAAKLTANQAINMITSIANLNAKITESALKSLQIDRLHREAGPAPERERERLTLAEAEQKVAAVTDALRNAKQVGGFEVISGGQATPRIGRLVKPV